MTELTGNFMMDLSNFEKLSREVGYANCKANLKDHNDNYDETAAHNYEVLRSKQLDFQELMIKQYQK